MRSPIPAKLRTIVKNKFNGLCGYCGCVPSSLQIDHIKPVEVGGTNDIDNLMPSCPQCNNFKSILSLEVFRNELAQQVYRAKKYSVNFRMAHKYNLVSIKEEPIVFYFERIAK